MSTSLIATKGYIAPEVEAASRRAYELCQQVGETPQLFSAVGRLQSLYLNRAELKTARELAEQLLRLAQETGKPRSLLWAHYALGFTLTRQGEFSAARAHLEQSIALYDPQRHRLSDFVQDPRVTGLALLAHDLLLLGYPDQALQRSQEALTLARQLAHPYSLAWVLDSVAGIRRRQGEPQAAQALTEEFIALTRKQDFTHMLTMQVFQQGWDLVERGRGEEGIAQMRQGLAALQTTRDVFARLGGLWMLAEAYGEVGQPEEGLNVLGEAMALLNKTEARDEAADLYWLQGELLLQSKAQDPKAEEEAEACLHKAIEIARQQQAKLLELQAVMSLARLWQQQGRKSEAHRMLAEIYAWFTEGFDTKDLQEAKALLDGLA